MPAPKKSLRPKARPDGTAPKKSIRPKARPDDMEERMAVERGNRMNEMEAKEGEALIKKAKGGMCRGMGAATKGGKFRMG